MSRDEQTLESQLSETVRLLMTRTGLRQVDIARGMGVTRGALSQRLLGNATWRLNDVPPVAEAFGLTVCELLSGYASLAQANRLPPAQGSEGQTRI
ncbi:XRE family transcriptional regulator [Streptomyces cinereoruber]|uniref:XRE family transcriptional regulator n=1 Tax=Streptomyces cinereoruber TaxID=67260 RepID=UPI0036322C51